MNRNTRTAFALTGIALTALLLAGCKKPPPPVVFVPPPPPPPPPVVVSLETIAKDLSADLRVQFASGLTLTEDKVDLGKAVVHLADDFARGDSKALKSLLTRSAQGILDDLTTSGGWEEATKPIEAVRVVLMQNGIEMGGVGTAGESAAEVASRVTAKVMEAMKGVPPEQLMAIQKALTPLMAGMDPATLATDPAKVTELQTKLSEAAKAAGLSEEVIAKLGDLGTQLAASAPAADASASAGGGSGFGVLLAIQDPKGSYVLGWSAQKVGDAWMFTNAPATGMERPRASLWDNVGAEGFQAVRIAAAPSGASNSGEDGRPGAPGSPGPGNPGSPSSPGAEPPSSPSSPSPVPPARAPGSPGRPPGSGETQH